MSFDRLPVNSSNNHKHQHQASSSTASRNTKSHTQMERSGREKKIINGNIVPKIRERELNEEKHIGFNEGYFAICAPLK